MLRGLADGSLLDQIRVQCVRLLSCGVNQQIENSIDALSREGLDPFNRPGVHVAVLPAINQGVGLHEAGIQLLTNVVFIQGLADDDDFCFPIAELGVP